MSKTDHKNASVQPAEDLAGTQYWNELWRKAVRQRPVDPRAPGVRNHLRQQMYALQLPWHIAGCWLLAHRRLKLLGGT